MEEERKRLMETDDWKRFREGSDEDQVKKDVAPFAKLRQARNCVNYTVYLTT